MGLAVGAVAIFPCAAGLCSFYHTTTLSGFAVASTPPCAPHLRGTPATRGGRIDTSSGCFRRLALFCLNRFRILRRQSDGACGPR
jgi:hypothetical protein